VDVRAPDGRPLEALGDPGGLRAAALKDGIEGGGAEAPPPRVEASVGRPRPKGAGETPLASPSIEANPRAFLDTKKAFKTMTRRSFRSLALAATFATLADPAAAGQTLRYTCDLHGAPGVLTAQVELVGNTGFVLGPGPRPDIRGVIGTGDATLLMRGELRSATALYVFTGRGRFADFTDMTSGARFRVRFDQLRDGSLALTANPFGPGPVRYRCTPG